MGIYLAVFAVTSLLFKLGEKVKKKQRIFLDLLAIVMLCMLAGLRAETVGTDTGGYFQPTINAALSSHSMYEYMNSTWMVRGFYHKIVSQYELGYSLFVWLTAKLFHSVAAVQFCVQMLIVTPLYFVLRKRGDTCVWLAMLVYDLFFFNNSLNAIRQSVAMSFVVVALFYWTQKEKKKSLLWVVLGTLFHTSALIIVFIIAVYEFIQRDKKQKVNLWGVQIEEQKLRALIVIIVGILLLVGVQIVVVVMQVVGLGDYVGYLGNGSAIEFMPNQIISRFPGLLLLLFNYKILEKRSGQAKFFVTMAAYSIIFAQLYGNSFDGGAFYGGRISHYFAIYNVFGYSIAASNGKYRKILTLLVIAYALFYWWFYYALRGMDGTVPYMILGS